MVEEAPPPSAASRVSALAVFSLMAFAVGAEGRIFHDLAEFWYGSLIKPPFTPADPWFHISWTLLIALMPISAALVWSAADGKIRSVRRPVLFFSLQLTALGAWAWLFFGLGQPWAGVAAMLATLALTVATIRAYWVWSPPAALLQTPFLAWALYATVLNAWIAVVN